jgi:chromosome segregation ATPase
MTLTRLIYSKEESRQANLQAEASASTEAGQILHLKRLLVTLKQHYEKTLQTSHIQIQTEQNQRITLQKELQEVRSQLTHSEKLHEEELQALRDQQIALKELLKKTQDELRQLQDQPTSDQPDLVASRQRVEQLERVIPYLRGRTEEANLETEQLREELDRAQKKLKALEQDLTENKQNAQKELEYFQQLLEAQQEDQLETVVSPTSSHHLRKELEEIKRNLAQGNQETKALETRYIEILNEKISLEHQCKQLQLQLEHQSSNLTSFQTQLHEVEDHKKNLEVSLQAKETELAESCRQQQELQKRIHDLDERVQEKDYIQDKYEQLKDEWKQLGERLEEAVEGRSQAEQHLTQLEMIAANQESQLQKLDQQLQLLQQEKQTLENERDQLKILLEESETRLKVAQQHLAKKVKEAALLSEKLEEQQVNLAEFIQTTEYQKTQLAQLQASVDLYQRQEKRLQDQLHDALKGTESQVTKWEEKYFRMYDKWQESENKIRELRKFEEKHHQMQNLLANLGNFMGGSHSNPNATHSALFHSSQEPVDRSAKSSSFDSPLPEESPPVSALKTETQEEKYDLFGMRQPQDTYKPNLFS